MSMSTTTDQLAIDGGAPLVTDLPERGLIGAEERAAVLGVVDRAIASGGAIEYGGAEEEAYCAEFAETLGGGYADAVNSGTAALYVALRALGVEPFTEVVVPAITDPGGIMPVPLLGCIPVVADTEPGSFNCGPAQIEEVLGPLTGAVVVAHIAGEPAQIEAITRLAERHGVPLIEDCAQAHGAAIGGAPVGSFGTVATFSTMWGKHHSTGGQGGVLFTPRRGAVPHDPRRRRPRQAVRGHPAGGPQLPGVAELQPGRAERRDRPCAARQAAGGGGAPPRVRAGAGRTPRGRAVGVQVPELPDGAEPSWWFLRLRYRPMSDWDKERFCAAVAAEGVPVNPTYAALPATYTWFRDRQVFGRRSGFPWTAAEYRGDPDRAFPCPNAHAAVAAHFTIPLRESWGEPEATKIAAAFARVDRAARRAGSA